jgi:hypothetical protein
VVKLLSPLPDALSQKEDLLLKKLYPKRAADDYLIPLAFIKDPFSKNKVNMGAGDKLSAVYFKRFEYDLGYAVTTYKLQGCTLDKLIVDLNQRPQGLKGLSLRALYVIISRLRNFKDLRIMPFREHSTPSRAANVNVKNFLDYIKTMEQSDDLRAWRSCINSRTDLFDKDKYLNTNPPKNKKKTKKDE